jgi:hypothetical protein
MATRQAKLARGEKNVIDLEKRGPAYAVPLAEGADSRLFDDAPTDDIVVDAALSNVMTELGGRDAEAKVTISKITLENGVRKDAYLFECHPSDFSLQDVQESYGAGDYRIKVYGLQEGTNYKVIHASKRITIGLNRDQARGKSNGSSGLGGVTVNAQGGEMAKAMADALAPFIGALAGMMKQPAGGRRELLEELKMMAEIVKPATPPQADPFSNLTGLTKVMELAKSFSGGGDSGGLTEESGPYAVLMKALETFGAMMQTAREQGAAIKNENLQLSAPDPKPGASQTVRTSEPQPAAQPAANAENEQMETFLKMQLALFLNAAKAEGNPEIYAGLIVENAPEKLLDLMEAPTWFEELVKLAPDFANHKPWCEQVRNIALDALKETEEPAPAGKSENLPLSAADPKSAASQPSEKAKSRADS